MKFAAMRLLILAMFVTLGLNLPAFAQAPIRAITPESITIYNFAKVNGDYYRGGQPLGDHYADLAAIGVKTVINLTNDEDGREEEKVMVEQYGMTYLHLPMSTRKPPTEQEIATFLTAGEAAGTDYVHCVGGRHGAGVMTALYRMTKDGLSGDEAFKEMKRYKYGPDFLHPEFKRFVYHYQPRAATAAVAATHQ